jgi:hypothetical protein
MWFLSLSLSHKILLSFRKEILARCSAVSAIPATWEAENRRNLVQG